MCYIHLIYAERQMTSKSGTLMHVNSDQRRHQYFICRCESSVLLLFSSAGGVRQMAAWDETDKLNSQPACKTTLSPGENSLLQLQNFLADLWSYVTHPRSRQLWIIQWCNLPGTGVITWLSKSGSERAIKTAAENENWICGLKSTLFSNYFQI